MNEGFTPNRSPEEEPDPLLEALRQRLGSYGQEPSPELWAGIRQQLPTPAPRPWWLRARRLLPLLAGLLLVSLVLVRQASRQPLTSQPAAGTATGQLRPNTPTPTRLPAGPATLATASAPLPPVVSAAATSKAASPGRTLADGRAATVPDAAASQRAGGSRLRNSRRLYAARAQGLKLVGGSPSATARPAGQLLATSRNPRRQLATHELAREGAAGRGVRARAAGRPWAAATLRQAALIPPANRPLAVAEKARRHRAAAARHPAPALAPTDATAFTSSQRLAGPASGYAAVRRRGRTTQAGLESGSLILKTQTSGYEVAIQAAGADTLAFRRAGLRLPISQLPAPLAARPDSFAPRLAPVRRWAVLGLIGPTLSYRTLPSTGGGLAYAVPTATASFPGTRVSTSPDYASLERPAAGLGAQVQVRRVLSGRWALALGLGYQEYATRLKLQVSTRQGYVASTSNYLGLDTIATVNQRDTYRLLTLPVQLSYALGPPHGRLALGLLAGAEPGWYLGGRTTENSSCSCQQQSFSSASGSPYSTLSLAVSLGLDVRYRLGGPASRWQLVLQPTGRYITSAFVRSTSLGYVRRQPYSFGLLTGLSWDLR
ncbi:MAG: PorT family protein [Hymenobacter sp.]|nr:MAG: PorT family protein [Hymenobacter sp.]